MDMNTNKSLGKITSEYLHKQCVYKYKICFKSLYIKYVMCPLETLLAIKLFIE